MARFELSSFVNQELSEEEQREVDEGEAVGRRFLRWELGEGDLEVEEMGVDELKKKIGHILGFEEEEEEEEAGGRELEEMQKLEI